MMEPLIQDRTRSADSDDEVWVLDSSVRKHYVRCKKLFRKSFPCFDGKYMEGFSGLRSEISRIGEVFMLSHGGVNIKLLDVSYVTGTVHNLISVSKLTTNFPFSVIFHSSGFIMKNLHTKKDIVKGQLHSNQYLWPRNESPNCGIKSFFSSIHRQLMITSKELPQEDNSDDNRLPEFQQPWPNCHRIKPSDVEHKDSWIMSSYATQHIAFDPKSLQNPRALPQEIMFPDFAGRTSPATHVGEAYLKCSGGQGIVLHEVLLVPASTANYISVAQLTLEYPSSVEFRSNGFRVTCREENRLIAAGPKHRGLYMWLNISKSSTECNQIVSNSLI